MESQIENIEPQIYNTPLEIGLRTLIILNKVGEGGADIEKLMYWDYLSLNTYDIGGAESIHAPTPNRGVQVYARKDLIQKGISLLISKELVDFKTNESGFCYEINKTGSTFLEYFSTSYFKELSIRVEWVIKKLGNYSIEELRKYISSNLKKWGSEFLDEI